MTDLSLPSPSLGHLVFYISIVSQIKQDVFSKLEALTLVHGHHHQDGVRAVGYQQIFQLKKTVLCGASLPLSSPSPPHLHISVLVIDEHDPALASID